MYKPSTKFSDQGESKESLQKSQITALHSMLGNPQLDAEMGVGEIERVRSRGDGERVRGRGEGLLRRGG